MQALQATVVFTLLAPHSPEQQTMLHKLAQDEKVEAIDGLKGVLKLWTRKEIIREGWGAQEMLSLAVIGEGDMTAYWTDMMRTRVIQHNIRVVAGYYQRVTGTR